MLKKILPWAAGMFLLYVVIGLFIIINGKDRSNDLFIGSPTKPKKDGTDKVTIKFWKPNCNLVSTIKTDVPVKKSDSEETKAKKIVDALNSNENLNGKLDVGQNKRKPAMVEMCGLNGWTIKKAGLKDKSKQGKFDWNVNKDRTARKVSVLTLGPQYDWFQATCSVEGFCDGAVPDVWEFSYFTFKVKLSRWAAWKGVELLVSDFPQGPEYLIANAVMHLQDLGLGEVTSPTPLSIQWDIPVGKDVLGVSFCGGCDDRELDMEWMFGWR